MKLTFKLVTLFFSLALLPNAQENKITPEILSISWFDDHLQLESRETAEGLSKNSSYLIDFEDNRMSRVGSNLRFEFNSREEIFTHFAEVIMCFGKSAIGSEARGFSLLLDGSWIAFTGQDDHVYVVSLKAPVYDPSDNDHKQSPSGPKGSVNQVPFSNLARIAVLVLFDYSTESVAWFIEQEKKRDKPKEEKPLKPKGKEAIIPSHLIKLARLDHPSALFKAASPRRRSSVNMSIKKWTDKTRCDNTDAGVFHETIALVLRCDNDLGLFRQGPQKQRRSLSGC